MFQRIQRMDWKLVFIVAACIYALCLVVAAALTIVPKSRAAVPDLTARDEAALADFDAEPGAPAALCRNALAQAKAARLIPKAAALTDPDPRQSDWERRYICDAAAQEENFALTLDHLCANGADARCVSLVTVSKDDGEVIYQRAD